MVLKLQCFNLLHLKYVVFRYAVVLNEIESSENAADKTADILSVSRFFSKFAPIIAIQNRFLL